MGLGSFLFGRNSKVKKFNRFTPQQQGLQNQSINQALSLLGGGMQPDMSGFAPIAQKARTQFNQQTIPSIAERFTSLGGQDSSAFAQTLGAAGKDLEEGLASLGAQYGQNQQALDTSRLSQLLGYGLSPSFDYQNVDGQRGLLGGLIGQGANALGTYFGGGGTLGGILGGLGNMFSMQRQTNPLGSLNPQEMQVLRGLLARLGGSNGIS